MNSIASNDAEKSTTSSGHCWCGGNRFEPAVHPSYSICQTCGNAVYNGVVSGNPTAPPPDINQIYGDEYWKKLQRSRGAPTLEERSRGDLPSRCAYWLRNLLRFVTPPGKFLELGSGHGGFLKMMAMCGFDVTGMEISQAVVDEAASRFGIKMFQGFVEDHETSLGTFNAIAMMDVVEHLTDPVRTLSTVARLLEPTGVLMIQMPEFKREYKPDWMMFIPGEHTFLHTRESAVKLCATAGMPHVVFVPAIYSNHDQFLFASKSPIAERSKAQIESGLLSRPDSRMMLALLDSTPASYEPPPDGGGTSVRISLRELRRAFANFTRRKLRGK